MKRDRIIYYIATGLLTANMLFSAGMYVLNHDYILAAFTKLGYPTYIIYPLAAAKILGLIAIWTKKSPLLKDLAYAGFFYNFFLAFFAHVMVGDSEWPGSLMAMTFLIVSFVYDRKLFKD